MQKRLNGLFLLLLLLISPMKLLCAGDLTVERVVLQNTTLLYEGAYTSLGVTLKNSSTDTLSGTIQVTLKRNSLKNSHREQWEYPFSLKAKSNSLFSVPLRAPSLSGKKMSALTVRVFSNTQKIYEEKLFCQPKPNDIAPIIIIDQNERYFGVSSKPFEIDNFNQTVRASVISPKNLPLTEKYYNAVSLILCASIEWDALSFPQRSALQAWVQNGGHIILLSESLTQGNPFALFTPLSLISSSRIAVKDTPFQKHKLSSELLLYPNVSSDESSVYMWYKNYPLWAQKKYGLGTVSSCALDTKSLAKNKLLPSLISKLAPPSDITTQFSQKMIADADAICNRTVGSQVPTLRIISLLIGCYLLLILSLFTGAHLLRRPELAWFALIPMTIIALIGIYKGAQEINHGTRYDASLTTLAQLPPHSTFARTTSLAAIYTDKQFTTSISSTHHNAHLAMYNTNTTSNNLRVRTYQTGAQQQIKNLIINPKELSICSLQSDTLLPFTLDTTGEFTAEGPRFTISHTSPEALHNCLLLLGRSIHTIGTLLPNTPYSFVFTNADVVNITPNLSGADIKNDDAAFAQDLLSRLMKEDLLSSHSLLSGEALFIGWNNADISGFHAEGLSTQQRTLIITHIPLKKRTSLLSFPFGSLERKLTHSSRMQHLSRYGYHENFREGSFQITFFPPLSLSHFKASQLKLRAVINQKGVYTQKIELLNWRTGSFVEQREALSGERSIDSPHDYVTATGEVTLRVSMLLNTPQENLQNNSVLGRWKVDLLDLSITGESDD
jgi:hypothetical protein